MDGEVPPAWDLAVSSGSESTTPRRVSNGGDDDLVVLGIGAKDGYVERDGSSSIREGDLPRRQAFAVTGGNTVT